MEHMESKMQDVIEGGLEQQRQENERLMFLPEGNTFKYLSPEATTLAFLDTETGGFSTTKNGVCEIAVLITDEELEPVAEYQWLIKPYTRANDTDELVSYKDDAMAIHGITVEQLETEGEDVREVCENLLNMLYGHNVRKIIGHNVKAFDLPRVEHLINRFTERSIKAYPAGCTLELSRAAMQSKSHKLEDLCEALGIEQGTKHRALSDCYSALGLLKHLQKSYGLNINQTPSRHGME